MEEQQKCNVEVLVDPFSAGLKRSELFCNSSKLPPKYDCATLRANMVNGDKPFTAHQFGFHQFSFKSGMNFALGPWMPSWGRPPSPPPPQKRPGLPLQQPQHRLHVPRLRCSAQRLGPRLRRSPTRNISQRPRRVSASNPPSGAFTQHRP